MTSSHKHDESHQHHLTPLTTYYKVFAGLITLTILTVATSLFDFGVMNIVVAMIIAVMKASLVVALFMQLKFDDIGNKVTFLAAFIFLSIFILLTGSDLFFRRSPEPLRIENTVAAGGETDQNKLRVVTPDLLKRGKEIFSVQCVTCHGAEGKGDGVVSAGLVPPPRNFTTGFWRYGGSPTKVFHTISVGSPGTAMASFSSLSIADRYALAHYVRSLSPNHPDDTPADLKAAGLMSADGKPLIPKAEPNPLPIDVAMDKLETPDEVIMPSGPIKNPGHPGAGIYMSQCLNCHGVNGVGAQLMATGVNPSYSINTASWIGIKSAWVSNQSEFEKIVEGGYPGHGMPAMDHFTKQELAQLYSYIREIVK